MKEQQNQVINELINDKQKLEQWSKQYPSFLDAKDGISRRYGLYQFLYKMLCENYPTIFTGEKTEYNSLRCSEAGKSLIQDFKNISAPVVYQRNLGKRAKYKRDKKNEGKIRVDKQRKIDDLGNSLERELNALCFGYSSPEAKWVRREAASRLFPVIDGQARPTSDNRQSPTGAGSSTSKRSKHSASQKP